MRKTLVIFLLLLGFSGQAFSGNDPHRGDREKKKRTTLIMGRKLARDTTVFSRRSLKTHLIVPKNDWQIGMAASYTNLSANNSEFLLLLKNSNSYLSLARISVNAAYAYADNQAAGLRIQYTNGSCNVDATTLDLLGNFSYDLKNISAKTLSYSSFAFNRSYLGLDGRGRVGLFLDVALGYTRSRTDINSSGENYTVTNKIGLSLSPGVVYFPMNTISVFAAISLADLSYNNSRGHSGGEFTGQRNYFRAQGSIDLFSLNFGLTVHL